MKQKLLNLNIFVDNDYFDKYIALCINAKSSNYQIKDFPQKHHIIPRTYFKLNNLPLDNSKENVIKLNYADHILAHYYLSKCTTGNFQYRMIRAFTYLTNNLIALKYCSEEDVKQLISELETLYLLDKQNESNKLKAGKWVNNGTKQLYVGGSSLEIFLKNYPEFSIGKLPPTEEQRQIRRNKQAANKNKIVINNTKVNKYIFKKDLADYLEAGWVLGRYDNNKDSKLYGKALSEDTKQKIAESLKTRYEAGEISAWNKGLTKETDATVANYSKNNSGQFKTGSIPWNTGKHFSEEVKTKMRKAAEKRAKQVLCIELNLIFNSVAEASKFIGHEVGDCCRGKNKTAGGYHWKFINNEEETNND